MSSETRDRFVTYYTAEMSYLRNAGHAFSQTHPKIARRLELSDKESADPHTERLLESFAFLTARLAQEIDNRFPEIANALLGVLYPHLVSPIPSMSIAHFQTDPINGKITKKHIIEKGTSLFCHSSDDVICKFKTVYPVNLLPLELIEASFIQESTNIDSINPWYLKLELKLFQGITLHNLEVNDLTFYISANRQLAYSIYESLFSQKQTRVYIKLKNDTSHIELPKDSLYPLGFSENEMMLPTPAHGTNEFLLLQEFFSFPEKFMFLKL